MEKRFFVYTLLMKKFTVEADEKEEKKALPKNKDFQRGCISGTHHINYFSELDFTLPEGWEYCDDEDMDDILDMSSDDGELIENVKATTVYDMFCEDPETEKSVMILYEDISLETDDPDNFHEEDYIDSLVDQFDSFPDSEYLRKDGNDTVYFGDHEYLKASFDVFCKEENMAVTQTYYVRKIGSRMAVVIFTGDIDDDMSVYEDNFSW